MLAQVEALHPNDVRVVFRHFPLYSIHDKASLAGEAAEAAGAQGAFWEMHDYLFDNYADWYSLPPEEFVNYILMHSCLNEYKLIGEYKDKRKIYRLWK